MRLRRLLPVAALVAAGACSANSRPASPACSPAETAADLGTTRSAGLSFLLLDADGVPVAGFWWRYRTRLLLPGRWSEWYHAEDDVCRRYCSCGYGGVTDQDEGTYEVEICRPGGRAMRALIDLHEEPGRPGFVVLRAPEDSGSPSAQAPCGAGPRRRPLASRG